ncbi:glyoxylase-like metal-dependent hydrolase (beta-lactamase superfamily II) [Micromonospora pisi]|uniref:Glyoxylase-like metal-dependent hydrolase (Beta-lactamase superfamily II) n=1 Tax=Micromonospora pisi TaxID=589240 RepID=A0A495JD46_9ACTN|nr:MBL fold metallo-hydrolase [Micromonospora pisi]RKR86936.1 glyoxylase-like metal-dependent hydrolase (beta-lactamase superfamily II) [Micromonospora pisi]
MSIGFDEVGERVYLLRHPVLDVNVTLVVGDDRALLVDTLSTATQAAELAVAVRALTGHPWILVNTHHHFDHCFGNATLVGEVTGPVYAHTAAAARLRDQPELVRQQAYDEMRDREPALAEELTRTTILAPTHTVHLESTLDLGGRTVVLRHLGRGHTDGDLVVQVPDADLLVAGDLVESSGPPSFDDSYPLEWPETVAELLRLTTPNTVTVPGHGPVFDTDQVRAQHEQLATLAWLIRDGHADGAPAERVAARAPFGPEVTLPAIRLGYAELGGDT